MRLKGLRLGKVGGSHVFPSLSLMFAASHSQNKKQPNPVGALAHYGEGPPFKMSAADPKPKCTGVMLKWRTADSRNLNSDGWFLVQSLLLFQSYPKVNVSLLKDTLI